VLREQIKLFNRFLGVGDFLILVISMFMAHAITGGDRFELRQHFWILSLALPLWVYLLAKYKLYAGGTVRKGVYDVVTSVLSVHILGGSILAGFLYFLQLPNVGRRQYLAFLCFSFVLFSLERLTIRNFVKLYSRSGLVSRNLIIVGAQDKALEFYQLIQEHSAWGMKVLGFVQIMPKGRPKEWVKGNILGQVEDLIEICKQHPVDEVVFCPPKNFIVDTEKYVNALDELGVTVRLTLDFYQIPQARQELSFFHDQIPVLTFYGKAFNSRQLFLKRLLDIFGSLVGLLLTCLLLPFIAYAIKQDSPGPLLFGQERVGQSGRTFRCWKFRSMYIDAEERKKDLMAQNEMSGAIFKIKDDPRVTIVGRFLRKTSLDELPQFWNVLKGEMSLVGTRPPTPSEVAEYENWHRRRISIKPGITGNWQISGRSSIEDFDSIVNLDLQYIDNWTIWLDIKILIKTILVVFSREGSC